MAVTTILTTISDSDGNPIETVAYEVSTDTIKGQPITIGTSTLAPQDGSQSDTQAGDQSLAGTAKPTTTPNAEELSTITTTVASLETIKGGATEVVLYETLVVVDAASNTQPAISSATASPIASADASDLDIRSGGLSVGAVAGAAVGGVVGGLLIGLLAAFFFFRRKKSQQAVVSYAAPEPKPYGPTSTSATPPPDNLQLNQFLALATPDNDLSSELHSLGDLTQMHVENNYHSRPVKASPTALAQALANLGIGSHGGLTADEVAALALDTRTRQTALQHVLAHVLFTSIDFSSKSRLTMLPAPIAAFLQSMPPVEKLGGNHDAMNLALSRWRTLAAFLLNPTRSNRNTLAPSETSITPQASGLVNALNSFLSPFVSDNQQQSTHLQAVVLECTKFGYTLFSQPSDWKINLSATLQPGYRMAVVCAGLDKLTTNEGQPYRSPNSVSAPTLVQV
ncbi:uncharacterized protein MKZ38_003020 [Zalerion maritima]|uniref:Uncharacterized protein n=1 Tax=Zalerion maritima TaxID=339359 RepID=A0AAD5RUQ4_9PEZI|nr:uncharacterized protein MKZ38_003020 [Zalerion maritima]